ncbi:ABC transporter substrate-binding protein [uncultured Intestinimonas sp.]|uniref:ABC transporter substrate-binding protein n=1 Tax=uncultured Intestinimonas sp. TaxID=1689265 RepID=UPI002605C472|nr:ABC transporter substrate-binding protein [uncultured Intestinimonas sp.]
MRSRKKFPTFMAACALSISLLAGCTGGTTVPSAESGTGGTSSGGDEMFNIILTAPFSGFDPLRTNDYASTYVTSQIYETLYRIDPETGEYLPLLATDLPEYSEDGLTATIKLREGVTFHDGTPFNSEAVKYTFELIQDPDFGSARASIANSIESMECPDDYTIVFHLLYEDGVFTAKLAHTNSAIVSPTAQQAQDLMVEPCGTGPYKFVSSVSGSNVVLTRNEDYWGELPAIKDVTMTVITDESTAVSRMETGEADFMPNISVEQLSRVENNDSLTFGTSEAAAIYYIGMRAESSVNPIMQEKDFRIALAKGIDKEGYVEYMMQGYAEVAKSVIGPEIFGYEPEAEEHDIAYDPEGAKAILDAHPGWADEEILFLVPSTSAYAKIGEYMQSSLTQAGFNDIKIESIDYSAWTTESKEDGRFDITVSAWMNVTRDGTELMEPNFDSVEGHGRARLTPEDAALLDSYIEASKTTADTAARTEALLECNAILMDGAYVQPVYNASHLFCYNDTYTGITMDVGGTFYICDFDYAA